MSNVDKLIWSEKQPYHPDSLTQHKHSFRSKYVQKITSHHGDLEYFHVLFEWWDEALYNPNGLLGPVSKKQQDFSSAWLSTHTTCFYVLQVAFGIDLNTIHEPDSLFPTAIKESLTAPIWCLTHPLHAIDFTSYGYQNTVVAAIHFLRDTGKKIIDERRKAIRNGDDIPSDILTYILKSVDQDASVDYEELLDHFVTFFIAGKLRSISLTSSGTWLIWSLISQNM